jgi:outer membrane protein, heavy metal efflux system
MLFICTNRFGYCCKLFIRVFFLLVIGRPGMGQAKKTDTLTLSLPAAEKIFLEKNLALLAQQYNIDISKALVQQARYWDNPVLNTDQNIYDGKFFRHDNQYGQVFLQIQQLIRTAGKRNKSVKLANDQVLTAQQQFNDMMRNLKYLLRNDMATVYQLLQTDKIYTDEISAVEQLVKGMDAQLQAGNISQKDNIRMKALLFSLQSDQTDVQRQLADVQSDLGVLLQKTATTFIAPDLSLQMKTDSIPLLNLQQLLDSAKINRPDAQLAQTNLSIQQHNLAYQKALAVPDLNVGIEYDQRSSYITNYYGLAISLPIPILNRNKGNITAAQSAIKQAQTNVQQMQSQVEQDVSSAYNKLMIAYRLKLGTSSDLQTKYDQLLQSMILSYRQRQVSLLEFLDFFGAYKDARQKQLQQDTNLRSAAEEINLSTGKDMIHLN